MVAKSLKNEGLYPSDVIKWEEEDRYSREVLTIAPSETIVIGQVLEKFSGGYGAVKTAGNAKAIALSAVTTGSGETMDIVCLVREAKVITDNLSYGQLNKAEVMAALKTVGIISSDAPTDTNPIIDEV